MNTATFVLLFIVNVTTSIPDQLVLKIRIFYDSSFFVLNQGLPSQCDYKLDKILVKLRKIFKHPSLGTRIELELFGESELILGDDWRADEKYLSLVGQYVNPERSDVNQNIFITAHCKT
jgi:hypothetical protein